jgi:hypothetical protein
MAYDPPTQRVVLFGGLSPNGTLSDTWTWDGNAWDVKRPPTVPPGREIAALGFDETTNKLILAGGEAANKCPVSPPDPCRSVGGLFRVGDPGSDVWAWDGTTRSNLGSPPMATPNDRFAVPKLLDDPLTGRMMLLGEGPATFPPTGLSHVRPDPNVGASDTYVAAYDARNHRVIAVEHFSTPTPPNSAAARSETRTWAWDGTRWTQVTAQYPSLFGLSGFNAAMATDPSTGEVLLVDAKSRTWRLKQSNWTLVSTALPPLHGFALADYPPARQVMLFGGSSTADIDTASSDTWTWDGTTWTRHPATTP